MCKGVEGFYKGPEFRDWGLGVRSDHLDCQGLSIGLGFGGVGIWATPQTHAPCTTTHPILSLNQPNSGLGFRVKVLCLVNPQTP